MIHSRWEDATVKFGVPAPRSDIILKTSQLSFTNTVGIMYCTNHQE
jgi:hypothetical protein